MAADAPPLARRYNPPMRRILAVLVLALGIFPLAAPIASAAVAASAENRASGSAAGLTTLIGIEARLSEEAVWENAALDYDIASDDAVAAKGGARATAHGAERLARSGFTDDLVKLTKTEGQVLHQSDGAKVFLRESSPGRFDFIVEGERGVITAHRNWSQKSIDGIAKNYGWGQ